MHNEDNYWKKSIVRKRVPNPIPIRVVTLPSTDVSDRYRQKLRFPEISKTNQAMSLWNQLSTANSRRVVVDIVSWFDLCIIQKRAVLFVYTHFILFGHLQYTVRRRDLQFADKILFRWHWTLRSAFGSSFFVITVIKTDWKSLWIQKRHLVIFTFTQCKMMMTGAKLHHVKWIPVPISNWNRESSSDFYFQ